MNTSEWFWFYLVLFVLVVNGTFVLCALRLSGNISEEEEMSSHGKYWLEEEE